jgi:hypothetical protein
MGDGGDFTTASSREIGKNRGGDLPGDVREVLPLKKRKGA